MFDKSDGIHAVSLVYVTFCRVSHYLVIAIAAKTPTPLVASIKVDNKMHVHSFQNPDSDKWNRYMFDYRFGGSDYSIDITARSPEEARERLNALNFARYAGEVKATIPVPSAGIIGRIVARLFQV